MSTSLGRVTFDVVLTTDRSYVLRVAVEGRPDLAPFMVHLGAVPYKAGRVWSMSHVLAQEPGTVGELGAVAFARMTGWQWDELAGLLGESIRDYAPVLDWCGPDGPPEDSEDVPR